MTDSKEIYPNLEKPTYHARVRSLQMPYAPEAGEREQASENSAWNDRRDFMLYVIDENMKRLNKHILMVESRVEKMRKTTKTLSNTSVCLNTLGVSSTSAGFVSALSGIGIIVSVPLGITAAASGLVGGILGALNNNISKNMMNKLIKLKNVYDVRTRLHLLYVKSINDGVLDESEFRNIMSLMTEFENIITEKYGGLNAERGNKIVKNSLRL